MTCYSFAKSMNAPTLVVCLILASIVLAGTAGAAEKPRAVATFECIGLEWHAAEGGCEVAYRKAGDEPWREALPLWFDPFEKQYRGSIVGLEDGQAYEVKLSPKQGERVTLEVRTRSNDLPIARTVRLPAGITTEPLIIREGGNEKEGYVLYEADAAGTTIDGKGEAEACIRIEADYVIVRGVKCVNGAKHGIRIGKQHHVVVDGCEVSQWGREAVQGYGERDHGIVSADGSHHLLIQRCRVFNPNYGTASWGEVNPVHKARHPRSNHFHTYGPNAIGLNPGPGSNVIRWNEIFSTNGQYFEDGIGVPRNGHRIGFPGANCDIYQNLICNIHDEAIECDGSDRNVRVWGNYIHDAIKGIVATPAVEGPIYIFRNVMGLCRKHEGQDGTGFVGNGCKGRRAGKVYIFHNTMLPAGPERARVGLWGGYRSGPMRLMSRNNIWHCTDLPYASTVNPPHGSNSYDYDLTSVPHDAYMHPPTEEALARPANVGHDNRDKFARGKLHYPPGTQQHGIVAVARYREGHGWDRGKASGLYQLAAGSPGVDQAQRLPNFNDGFTGKGPDIGAHERGTPAMKFGVAAAPD